MQYFEKGIHSVQWGLGQSLSSWGIFENFRVKSSLTVCTVTFNCKLRKKMGGAGCTSCSPNNFVGGNCSPCSPGSRAYGFIHPLFRAHVYVEVIVVGR